ncbi:CCGSCS motif protein [Marinobacter halophilus]|uniref:CCGSCS motif protein n=2 Tax=Marinobacter halophilus TaxID=1323740 RepID=A0A2T1KGU6_9GAMM|nr:CCGSCS motif protein [Marinobacter halophilus]
MYLKCCNRETPMKLSFLNMVKKEDSETESSAAPAVEVHETAEASQDEAQSKGKHGKDFCCGSCS